MEERTYERDVARTFESRTLIPRLVSRGLPWQGSIPGKRMRFLQVSFAVLLLITGAFLHSTATAFLNWTSPDPFDAAFSSFRQSKDSHASNGQGYPASFFKSVLPIPCHSHNDYWRYTPVYAALGTGCVSIEADVWLRNGELYVGHTPFDLTNDGTLLNTYINPLKNVLETVNSGGYLANDAPDFRGVFYMDPAQTLTLLIDFKSEGPETLRYVDAHLQPLRERGWLTHWNGTARVVRPLTIVVSGNAPFDLLVSNQTYRDIFYDAPLDSLHDPSDPPITALANEPQSESTYTTKYNPSNSYLASAKLGNAVGPLRSGRLSARQLHAIQSQTQAAKARGLIPRYWGTPRWPRNLRDEIWAALVRQDTGLLSVDDLRAVRKGHWGLWPQEGPRK